MKISERKEYEEFVKSVPELERMECYKIIGITWEDCNDSKINHMRSVMALQKAYDSKAITLEKFKELREEKGQDMAIVLIRAIGISWKEEADNGINWMRGIMALKDNGFA